MLKVEVFDSKLNLIETKIFNFSEIFIGRSKKSDLILIDPAISRQHLHLSQNKDGTYIIYGKNIEISFSAYYELKDSGYTFKFHNLELISDEITQETSFLIDQSAAVFKTILSSFLLLIVFLILDIYLDFHETQLAKRISSLLYIFAFGFGLTTFFSLISKAIVHQFQFKKFLYIHILLIAAFIFIYHNYFGLRWLIPSFGILNYDEAFLLFNSLIVLFYFIKLSKILFPQVILKIRVSIGFSLFILCLLPIALKYFPNKNGHRYFQFTITPPLIKFFEQNPITTENYLLQQKELFK